MKQLRNIFLILAVVIAFTSCKKYLDVVPDDIATLDIAFDNRNNALNYLFTCYNYMQQREVLYQNPGWTTSGEIIDNATEQSGDYYFGSIANNFRYLRGIQKPDAPVHDNFGALYQAIRKCNTFLENIDRPRDLTAFEKERWVAEVKFVKAYYYFLLVRQYGPVPLVKENMPISTPTDEAKIPRAPSDDVFAYIVQLLDEASPVLPAQPQVTTEYGRATNLMALALKAKVLVTQASPLFNGDPAEAQLKGPDGQQLFPATYDAGKWTKAVAACKAAIDLAQANGVVLYYSQPISVIPAAIRQQFNIQDPVTAPQTLQIPENIWPGNVGVSFQDAMMPNVNQVGGGGSLAESSTQLAVPMDIAELFYTNNGVPINEDKNWDYANRYALATAPNDPNTQYYVKPAYSTIKLHLYREPRFYADLAFDGGVWYGSNGQGIDTTRLPVQNSLFSRANNLTGYWPKKLIPYSSFNASNSAGFSTYYPPVMRLADLYLLYAEALNEANSGPTQEAYTYIDLVRARAGLQGVVQSWAANSNNPDKPATQAGFRSIVHQERRIELCFEGEIGWDLRRWKEYAPLFAGHVIQGWNGFSDPKNDPNVYYQFHPSFTAYMSAKDYFWPINTTTLLNNKKLVQNIGWQ